MHPSLLTGQSEAEAALGGALQAPAGLGAGDRRPGQEQQRGVLLQDAALVARRVEHRLQEELHVFNQLRRIKLVSGAPESAGKHDIFALASFHETISCAKMTV